MTLLPPVNGPNIGPFKYFGPKLNIKFIVELGDSEYACVWKVDIGGVIYALKLFKREITIEDIDPSRRKQLEERDDIDENEILQSLDPFSNECRAYGRLEEVKKTNIGAACYGYLLLNHNYARDDLDGADFSELEWVESKEQNPGQKVQVRAIVKEYMASHFPFSEQMIPQMLQNLKTLHRYGIIHQGIHEDNYREGLLIDFSTALTVPHYLLDKKRGFSTLEEMYDYDVEDGSAFDLMISKWSAYNDIRVWHRFLPNPRYRVRLRSEKRTIEALESNDIPAFIQEGEERRKKLRAELRWHAADYKWKEKTKKQKVKRIRIRKKVRRSSFSQLLDRQNPRRLPRNLEQMPYL
ncbi:hypothetical protein EKO27_g9031 [Xylaria grammica]|uniref:Protein kinase domain-containing protein n=1 Tax=Xylaria grammica TaxID=363999 RepID=A0A439CVB2_9PEZI|nr:hypothetical protein EKO27_g9031 [Xylaria grammica]